MGSSVAEAALWYGHLSKELLRKITEDYEQKPKDDGRFREEAGRLREEPGRSRKTTQDG